MNRLDSYIFSTVAMTMALAVAGLLGLLIILTFLEQMKDVVNDYTIFHVFRFVLYSMPRMFYEVIPYSALIGCLAGLGLLANSSELVVIRAAGISTWSIAWSALKPALILAFLGMLVGETLLPDSERMARVDRVQAKTDLVGITPKGGFWYRENNVYMHFDIVGQSGVLQGVTLYYFDEKEMTRSLYAERGIYHDIGEDKNYWLLEKVTLTELGGRKVNVEELTSFEWHTSLTPNLISAEIVVQPDKMSIRELDTKIEYMRTQGLNSSKFELGFWGKVFQPLATVGLVLVGISFIFGPLRESAMGTRVVMGVIIGFAFRFFQNLLSPASLVFGFSPIIATLAPITVCFAVGIYLFKRAR
ncbi:MAG TPA: LPS export ABC transporter permease LptG [Gammaproteobacteria bacterium]|nr:LPS export ABC transporter permease LptG [Gammaproteobacteria bacterium]|tara:strand:- start:710 stop:1786 length:1077 start_codon:yes stop_codon:yes gene_type:complete